MDIFVEVMFYIFNFWKKPLLSQTFTSHTAVVFIVKLVYSYRA